MTYYIYVCYFVSCNVPVLGNKYGVSEWFKSETCGVDQHMGIESKNTEIVWTKWESDFENYSHSTRKIMKKKNLVIGPLEN